ncbi:MAG TPA: SAM-dependent methyltransferase [Roseiflexaceae bacterium]|nr:SAM-dependent methyltransferase [Roseiflexaceae bacterium]
MTTGTLTIAGTGITLMSHLTKEAEVAIRDAERLFFLVTSELAEQWMLRLNGRGESLRPFYDAGGDRAAIYAAMSECALAAARAGQRVCAAFYGHPSVFVTPTQLMVRAARREGLAVRVLPGISAEDCLFADLDLDPGQQGCQSYEASDFLLRPRRFDPHTPLVLWQIGVVGYFEVVRQRPDSGPALAALRQRLLHDYPPDHPVTVYLAPMLPIQTPTITCTTLADLLPAILDPFCTLYIPPLGAPAIDQELCAQLGVKLEA